MIWETWQPGRCVSVSKLASFPRAPATAQEEEEEAAVCRDVCVCVCLCVCVCGGGSQDGCLWRCYLCCRAQMHCQSALIRGVHHPKTSAPIILLPDFHWSKRDTFKSSGEERTQYWRRRPHVAKLFPAKSSACDSASVQENSDLIWSDKSFPGEQQLKTVQIRSKTKS